jgi:toxin-antitoxin system PIN domain toxin
MSRSYSSRISVRALLDVNALIALVDRDHLAHEAMQRWFKSHQRAGWATCPLTENGMVGVLSQPAYPSGQRMPAEVIEVLNALKSAFSDSYEFWPDDISIADPEIFEGALIAGTRQVTDIYLLGLAARHEGVLVSFDRTIGWQAIRGGSARLVKQP